MSIREQLDQDAKSSLKNKEKKRLLALRLIIAEMQRLEKDTCAPLSDQQMIEVLEKMRKQRIDSIEQFKNADRQDLVDIEEHELGIIQSYLPAPLDDVSIIRLITQAIASTSANKVSDMGLVMAWLKPQVIGRVDMRQLSSTVRETLSTLNQ